MGSGMSSNIKVVKTDGHRNWAPLQMSSAVEKDAKRIYVVLSCVMEYLGLEDIKNCCPVCRKWNFVAKSFIPKLAAVHFPIGALNLDHLMKDISHLELTAFTFSSYRHKKAEYVEMCPWPLTELGEFFKSDWGQDIKTLKLKGLTLKNQRGKIIADFNLEPLLKPLVNLSELTVDLSAEVGIAHSRPPKTTTNIIVPLDKLRSLKVIQLTSCGVALPVVENEKGFSKIALLKLSLIDVHFYNQEKPTSNVILNEFVDFSISTEINVIMKKHLASVVINLTSELSNVRKLSLSEFKFDKKVEIPIKQIIFEDATIDLSILPQTIEKIYFKGNATFTIGQPLPSNHFPNLNFVAIDRVAYAKTEVEKGLRSFKSTCSYFQSRNLRHIVLESNLSKRHIGPFLEDEHRQQFLKEASFTEIMYKPSDTLPYKLNAGFAKSLKQGTFSME